MKKCVHLVHLGKQNCQMGTVVLHYAQTACLVLETTTWKKSRRCPNVTSFSKPSPNSLARGAPSFAVLQPCGITLYQLSSAALQVSPKLSSWKQILIISQFLRQFRHSLAGCLWFTGCNHVTIHSCGQWCASDPLGCWPEMSISSRAGISAGQLINHGGRLPPEQGLREEKKASQTEAMVFYSTNLGSVMPPLLPHSIR